MHHRPSLRRLLLCSLLALILPTGGVLGVEGVPDQSEATAADYELYHPSVVNDYYGHDSALHLQNSAVETATIVVEFIDPVSASPVHTMNATIPALGTLTVATTEIDVLPPGEYGVVVSSDQPLTSIVNAYSTHQGLSNYRGIRPGSMMTADGSAAVYLQHYGPFHTGDQVVSTLQLWNVSATTATYVVDLYDLQGVRQHTLNGTLAPAAQATHHAGTLSLPAGTMLAVVSSDQPIIGLLGANGNFYQAGSSEIQWRNALAYGATEAYLPRAFKNVDEGTGARSSVLFVANTGDAEAEVTLNFYDAAGQPVAAETHTLAAKGGALVDMQTVPVTDGAYAVIVQSAGTVGLSEATYYLGEAGASAAAYGGIPGAALVRQSDTEVAQKVYLPRVAATDLTETHFSVMNLGAADATVEIAFYAPEASPVTYQLAGLRPGSAQRFAPHDVALPNGFEGTAVISADQPIAAWTDEYRRPPCAPPENAQIQRTPAGTVAPDATAHFTATVQGTAPFTYTWDFGDGATGGGVTTSHAFAAAGVYTTTLSVANACGVTTAAHRVEVVNDKPDLSASQKTATYKYVGPGDVLTYTLVLRNETSVDAMATMTDPVPTHTTYISSSAAATQGAPLLRGDRLTWEGTVVEGAPVTVWFAVRVAESGLAPGDVITNSALLTDGYGGTYTLTTSATYNPGYRITLEDGALYTKDDVVDLDIAWNANDDVTMMWISNDGGFGSGTGWIPAAPTYEKWTLATMGETATRSVYVQFRDGEGNPTATIQDDILYDPIKPEINSVEVLSTTQASQRLTAGTPVTVRVTVSDTLSGAATLILSDDPSFGTSKSYPVAGKTTDLPWSLQPSGKVYVRALDVAGNLSDVVDEKTTPWSFVYLPMAVRR